MCVPTVNSRSTPGWLRFSSFIALVMAIVLFLTSLIVDDHSLAPNSKALISAVLFTLITAICLTARALFHLWTAYRRADLAFSLTSCECTSMFENVLNGILILDSEAKCLDANPAAASILRVPQNDLIGKYMSAFSAKCSSFAEEWSGLHRTSHCDRAELVTGDGDTVLVDFAAATDYLAGRHLFILCDVTERTKAEKALRESEERFRYVADNIQEIIWKMNVDTKEVVYVNPAYITITGHTIESLYRDPSFHSELIHPQDRIRVLSRFEGVVSTGLFDEEFRFVHADGSIRWLWVKAHRANDDRGRWIIGTAQDITSRKAGEEKIAEQLEATESARAEAEALRKATLALSQNLAMDSVLDTLLQYVGELVPFDRASVLFVEDAAHLMVAREADRREVSRAGFVLSASESVHLQEILFECKPVFLSNTDTESDWIDTVPFDDARSWMGIPLTAAGDIIGILSICAYQPVAFTTEHLRLARNLAVAAAVAIQNARVHERAAIYASALELRIRELHLTQGLLEQFRKNSLQ
jgi:PAS domain S-box-containing protein